MNYYPLPTTLLTAAVILSCTDRAPAGDVAFNRDVRPILADKCFACHGPDKTTREADLRLDDAEAARAVIEPHDPSASELIARITSDDPDERMPPAQSRKQLSPAEIAILTQWVEQGAEYEPHWAFIPPTRPSPPTISQETATQNAIDRFILARLEKEELSASPPAERATLLRRVTLDLTGLPPTPAETAAFLADNAPDAYEQAVDRLLASPRYGEHMASFWLDAARYADTDGYQNDRYRYQWVWRDWVIAALNANMPFDQFTQEQLAGDMLPDPTLRQQIATGFCRNHRINSEGGSIPEEWAVEYVVDRVETLGTVFLGLTIGCARCHEHKFDPVSQEEFYRLYAFFNNVPEWGLGPNNGNSPPFIKVPENWPNLSPDEDHAIPPAPYELVTTQSSVVRPKPGDETTVMVMQELDEPRPTYRLNRGQYNQPDKSRVLTAAVPESLATNEQPTNRLELAAWLTSPDHPLTARVTVNRYWQQYFGAGLVRTSENFGLQGEAPTHPELLDWLATEFIRRDWDVKALQRLIVTSATYKQSSFASQDLVARDPENRLLARGPRFRLPAFAIRDQALAASGLLVEEIGGESVKPYMPPRLWESISNNKYQQDHGSKLYRRSVYTYWRRTIPPPTMMTFNAAEREVCSVRKDRTNTPLQALTLMNNVAFVEASRFLAERILQGAGSSDMQRVHYGFTLVLGREPSASELALLQDAYAAFRARFAAAPQTAEQLLKTGEKPKTDGLDSVEHATLTMVASLILNLDEAVSRE